MFLFTLFRRLIRASTNQALTPSPSIIGRSTKPRSDGWSEALEDRVEALRAFSLRSSFDHNSMSLLFSYISGSGFFVVSPKFSIFRLQPSLCARPILLYGSIIASWHGEGFWCLVMK